MARGMAVVCGRRAGSSRVRGNYLLRLSRCNLTSFFGLWKEGARITRSFLFGTLFRRISSKGERRRGWQIEIDLSPLTEKGTEA